MDKGTETFKVLPNLHEVVIDKRKLYHGSRNFEIKSFNKAEETTIGHGVYLTSDAESARGYAQRRSDLKNNDVPTVYETEINGLKLVDLRTRQDVQPFSLLLQRALIEESKKKDLKWFQQAAIQRTLDKIKDNSYESLKDLTWNHQDLTTKVLSEQGFDGLIAIEGGEGKEVGEHDSYLIFDPLKVEVKSRYKI